MQEKIRMEDILTNPTPLLASTLLILFLVSFIILFVILYNKVQLNFKLERQQFQQDLLQTEIEIREQTLSNVSQELHDNVGQIAVLLKMNLKQVVAEPQSKQKLKESSELVVQLIQDIKSISSSLENNQLSKIGLAQAIEKDCERINKFGFITVQADCKTELNNLNTTTSVFLYRMYQEALNNVISHSKATIVSVSLAQHQENMQLIIEDNGIGFNSAHHKTGNGLANLRKRAKSIGAILTIESKIDQGTSVTIQFPLKPNHV